MDSSLHDNPAAADTTRLVVRRTVRATPEQSFRAWTEPVQLMQWWGPAGVECIAAEIDLRIGGQYRIGNRMPSGDVVWIVGEFEAIDYPHELIYSWRINSASTNAERIRVRFVSDGSTTEVIVEHEKIATAALRDGHERGWVGCLAGLAEFLSA